jgi:predicted nucleic acid-binding protein
MIVYLDSSAIVKRYVKEMGSDSVDLIYHAVERDPINTLIFSSWNLGEVFGAIDARFQRGDLRQEAKTEALSLLSQETKKFAAMRKISIIPVGSRILTKARGLILKYHIYQADALQIESAKQAEVDFFASADKRLLDCAKSEQLETLNPEKDYDLIKKSVSP